MIELTKKGESNNLVSVNGNWFLRPDKTRDGEGIIYIWPDRPTEQVVHLMGRGTCPQEAAGKMLEHIRSEREKLDRWRQRRTDHLQRRLIYPVAKQLDMG